ncbi:hypothetical protein M0802_009196 [Mischocyttarus mexicanus]|nr:hypothetical protein M0802_009196 [Mischocyttarus mexicanus]
MNTRSKSDKSNIEELYSQATRNPDKPENFTQPYTSSPYPRMSRQQSLPVDLDINHLTILKYAIKGISMFDGKNIPLKVLIRQCNAAKEMIPEGAEMIFIKMLKSRIIGDAYDTIDTGEDIKKIDQLLNPLVAAFGERNSNGELMRKLAETSQDPTESVHSFSILIKKIGLDIIQNYKTRNYGEVPDLILRTVEEDVRNQFLRGLLELERSLGLSPSARRSQFESVLDVRCQLCHQSGHRSRYNSQRVSVVVDSPVVCQICYRMGHIARDCRQRRDNSGCQCCEETGHVAKSAKNVIVCMALSPERRISKSMILPKAKNKHQKCIILSQYARLTISERLTLLSTLDYTIVVISKRGAVKFSRL